MYLDVSRERVPLDAASFQKENLKKVTPIVNDQVQRESSILVSNPIHCRLITIGCHLIQLYDKLTPICGILGLSWSVICGQKIHCHIFGSDDVIHR